MIVRAFAPKAPRTSPDLGSFAVEISEEAPSADQLLSRSNAHSNNATTILLANSVFIYHSLLGYQPESKSMRVWIRGGTGREMEVTRVQSSS